MKSIRLPARAAILAVIVSLAVGGIVGAAADRFVLHRSQSYEYLVFPAAGTLQPGQVVWLEASGRVAHANDNTFEARTVIGVVVRERAPRGSVAVAVQGAVEVSRDDVIFHDNDHDAGEFVLGPSLSVLGVALKVPATGPITVLISFP